jgi:hypothetical protein
MNFVKKTINHLSWRIGFLVNIQAKQIFFSLFLKKEVRQGPFKGMKYINASTGSVILPKIYGTYEKELNHLLNTENLKSYDIILDIGAAEGYYAVGLTRLIMSTKIIAFEATEKGRKMIQKLASLNRVTDRIKMEGFCDEKLLNSYLDKYNRPFIIMDIEGGEISLLDPELVPQISKADILVEIHTFLNKNIPVYIKERFKNSHHIQIINQEPRVENDIRFPINYFIKKHKKVLMNEFRSSEICWFYLKRK